MWFSSVRWAAVTQASAWGETLGGEMGRRKRGGRGDILPSSLKLELGPGQANRSSVAQRRRLGGVCSAKRQIIHPRGFRCMCECAHVDDVLRHCEYEQFCCGCMCVCEREIF